MLKRANTDPSADGSADGGAAARAAADARGSASATTSATAIAPATAARMRPAGSPLTRWRSAVQTLPRDARDTLFLLVVIGWVVALQATHLPWWTSLLTAGVLLWRGTLALRLRPLPGWPWRLALLLVTLAATWLTHRTLLGRDAGVTLIVVLLALKTLELRARRDAFVVFFLGFFTLLTHFFFSQSLATAIGILIALLGLLTALVNAHMPVGRPPLWRAARVAAGMTALGAPIMLVLFLLFPRMAPLWGMPGDGAAGRSGLSGTMRVGQLAQLVQDDGVAMRVRFEGRVPQPSELYFRGPVLSSFNGVDWLPLRSGFPAVLGLRAELAVTGAPVRYEITLEPHNQPWLLLLDATAKAPQRLSGDSFMTPELVWLAAGPVSARIRYTAESHLRFQHGPRATVLALQDQLELPPGYNPRTLAWAQSLRQTHGAGPDAAPALVQAALERLRTGGYSYTLSPGVYGRHTADEFWFDRREGFCEHIASAFVILMRSLDIPARIVTGYQGGELNSVDSFWTVRQRDAHAWAEVWIAGSGWVRVDPTAAIAPERIGAQQRLRAPEGVFADALQTMNPALAEQVRALWEAVNNRWNQWVLNYTQGQQLALLKRLGFASPSWVELVYALLAVLVLASGAGVAWLLWERRQHDPWLRLLDQARQRLQRLGIRAGDGVAPRALAVQVQQRLGDSALSQRLCDWLLRMENQRYARESPETLATLRREFRQFQWPRNDPYNPS